MTTDSENAYAAGFIDGDGSFMLIRKSNKWAGSYAPRISVTSSDPRILVWLKQRYGGYISPKATASTFGVKPVWIWQISHKKAITLIELIFPYLVVKSDQAFVLLCAAKTISRTSTQGRTDEIAYELETAKETIHELNLHSFPIDFMNRKETA